MDLRVVAVARSRQMVLGSTLTTVAEALGDTQSQPRPLDLAELIAHLKTQAAGGLAVVVDATASATLPDAYSGWLETGIHIVTPNKHAGAGPASRWQAIQGAAQRAGTLFRGEATVGAGLPVLSTLRALRETGDEIRSIEGVLSGSLAFLLDAWSRGAPFSETLQAASKLGYLEPDPREDLSGRDVVRKMVILARAAGHDLEAQQVRVAGLVPEALRDVSVEAFWDQAQVLDAGVEAILEETRRQGPAAGSVIRFLGSLSASGEVRVGPQALPPEHPFARLSGTGNAIAFRTRRYDEAPLMIQGPGAGPEVTASGMFADLLEIVATARS
jgi:aspartokinase/homoserine dehydrogenase 1